MTLYSRFDASSLPMLKPLLYTSTRLSPLRPYTNAVLARLLHADIPSQPSSPQWLINPPRRYASSKKSSGEPSRDEIIENDPRIIFGETEFKTKKDKYNTPKHVTILSGCADFQDLSSVSWITGL
jgi:hypothetical protein